MGQLKEADILRWENTKCMTGLGKAEQDGMWEAFCCTKLPPWLGLVNFHSE